MADAGRIDTSGQNETMAIAERSRKIVRMRSASGKLEDQTGGELRLPGDMEMKEDETAASAAGERGAVGVEKRGEHATVEAYPEVRGGEQLHAPAGAGSEANLIVAAGSVASEPEHA